MVILAYCQTGLCVQVPDRDSYLVMIPSRLFSPNVRALTASPATVPPTAPPTTTRAEAIRRSRYLLHQESFRGGSGIASSPG